MSPLFTCRLNKPVPIVGSAARGVRRAGCRFQERTGRGRRTVTPKRILASKTVIRAIWMLGWRLFSRSIGIVSTLILARPSAERFRHRCHGDYVYMAMRIAPLSAISSTVVNANAHVRRTFMGKVAATAAKMAVLVIATMVTKRLDVIAGAVRTCVAIEPCLFIFLLSGLPDVKLQTMLGPMARSLFAGAVVVLVLDHLGLAWQEVSMLGLLALVYLV